MSDVVLESIVICIALIAVLCLFIFASSKGWIKHLKFGFGKSAMEVQGVEKQKRSGALSKLLYDQGASLDREMDDYLIKAINGMHDKLIRYLGNEITHPGGKRLISAIVRNAVFNVLRRSDLKIALRPENFRGVINSCMLEINIDYDDGTRDNKFSECPIHKSNCFDFPSFEKIKSLIRDRLIQDCGYPLRNYQIRVHEKKIDLDRQFIPSFAELEDFIRADVAKEDIDKNKLFIDALSRKPETDKDEL